MHDGPHAVVITACSIQNSLHLRPVAKLHRSARPILNKLLSHVFRQLTFVLQQQPLQFDNVLETVAASLDFRGK
jgi:hypothetical protein